MKGVVQVVNLEDTPPQGPLIVGRLVRGTLQLGMEAPHEETVFKIRELLDENNTVLSSAAAGQVVKIVVAAVPYKVLTRLVGEELTFSDRAHSASKQFAWRPEVA